MNEYAEIDEMCTTCGGHATIIRHNDIKLCDECFKKMNNEQPLSEYSNTGTRDLIDEYKQLDELIHGNVCCYGKNDLYRFDDICSELKKRGVTNVI